MAKFAYIYGTNLKGEECLISLQIAEATETEQDILKRNDNYFTRNYTNVRVEFLEI